MNHYLAKEISQIKNDRESGSAEIAYKSLDLLVSIASMTKKRGHDLLKILAESAYEISLARPAMPALCNMAGLVIEMAVLEKENLGIKTMADIKRRIVEQKKKETDRLFMSTIDLLPRAGNVFTLSYSSTLLNILSMIDSGRPEIFVAESRPLMEGRKTCALLAGVGYKVNLVTDFAVATTIKNCSAVLIGADAVFKDGSVSNKTGSYTAAIIAKEFDVPFYVITHLDKTDPEQAEFEAEPESGEDVWPNHGDIAINNTFEKVPSCYVTCFVTEKGVVAPKEISEYLSHFKRRWRKLAALSGNG